jgi:hypothetical protein
MSTNIQKMSGNRVIASVDYGDIGIGGVSDNYFVFVLVVLVVIMSDLKSSPIFFGERPRGPT